MSDKAQDTQDKFDDFETICIKEYKSMSQSILVKAMQSEVTQKCLIYKTLKEHKALKRKRCRCRFFDAGYNDVTIPMSEERKFDLFMRGDPDMMKLFSSNPYDNSLKRKKILLDIQEKANKESSC